MKLILAIVNNDDSALAAVALTEEGFSVTKLATSGGFLQVGNTTFLIGTDDDRTQAAIDILKTHCTSRKQVRHSMPALGFGMHHMNIPEVVTVGGATIFVLDVDHMEKI